ncbi:hypothetical protein HK099_005745 [Clydaea vesicula]|uniref:Uncharacterized protein n=1 Tax=Clydaea vesicula TaxID=447962 RepID=A0AAD5TYR6_9FUNG|nr:hypothetical protein HK099_005745 [Clydaea vesicula]
MIKSDLSYESLTKTLKEIHKIETKKDLILRFQGERNFDKFIFEGNEELQFALDEAVLENDKDITENKLLRIFVQVMDEGLLDLQKEVKNFVIRKVKDGVKCRLEVM